MISETIGIAVLSAIFAAIVSYYTAKGHTDSRLSTLEATVDEIGENVRAIPGEITEAADAVKRDLLREVDGVRNELRFYFRPPHP